MSASWHTIADYVAVQRERLALRSSADILRRIEGQLRALPVDNELVRGPRLELMLARGRLLRRLYGGGDDPR